MPVYSKAKFDDQVQVYTARSRAVDSTVCLLNQPTRLRSIERTKAFGRGDDPTLRPDNLKSRQQWNLERRLFAVAQGFLPLRHLRLRPEEVGCDVEPKRQGLPKVSGEEAQKSPASRRVDTQFRSRACTTVPHLQSTSMPVPCL
jgi:hypothetical protein